MKGTFNPEMHRRRSLRLPGRDYGRAGVYFITICTQGREWLFGEVRNGRMELNGWGEIIQREWERTVIIRPRIIIDAFCVMPNHLHGIIVIKDNTDHMVGTRSHIIGERHHGVGARCNVPLRDDNVPLQEIHPTIDVPLRDDNVPLQEIHPTIDVPLRDDNMPLHDCQPQSGCKKTQNAHTNRNRLIEQFGRPTSDSIPTIVRLFKSTTTKQINTLRNLPGTSIWQRNYYERIIRHPQEWTQIRKYIAVNPENWETDPENPRKP